MKPRVPRIDVAIARLKFRDPLPPAGSALLARIGASALGTRRRSSLLQFHRRWRRSRSAIAGRAPGGSRAAEPRPYNMLPGIVGPKVQRDRPVRSVGERLVPNSRRLRAHICRACRTAIANFLRIELETCFFSLSGTSARIELALARKDELARSISAHHRVPGARLSALFRGPLIAGPIISRRHLPALRRASRP